MVDFVDGFVADQTVAIRTLVELDELGGDASGKSKGRFAGIVIRGVGRFRPDKTSEMLIIDKAF